MKVLFIDIDGVLNTERYVKATASVGLCIDPEKMAILAEIVQKTGALLVLSSSWREHWSRDSNMCDGMGIGLNTQFSFYGLSIYDKTPLQPKEREEQIRLWLNDHPETDAFAVLDDMMLCADYLKGRFIRTAGYFEGLTFAKAEECIKALNN